MTPDTDTARIRQDSAQGGAATRAEGTAANAAQGAAGAAEQPSNTTNRRGILRAALGIAAATIGVGAVVETRSGTAHAASVAFDASGYGGIAVLGTGSSGATGISGSSTDGFGVHGGSMSASASAAGVHARGYGAATELIGTSDDGNGVVAQSATFDAIHAIGGGGIRSGVFAEGRGGYGVAATSTGGGGRAAVYGIGISGSVGVQASSDSGYGVSAQGGLAPLYLKPAGSVGPPSSGTHQLGELFVDSSGSLYFCVAGGAPGTWKRVSLI